MTSYDAIIIGTGQAGPALARRLTGSGMQVAIVERGRFTSSLMLSAPRFSTQIPETGLPIRMGRGT